jgi:P pilus assembly chaperone PapD
MTIRAYFTSFGAALLLGMGLAWPARATTVTPVVVDLQTNGRGVVSNVSVNNTGASDLPMEVTVQPLEAQESGLVPKGPDTGDLLVVPPSAIIPAGQTQTFRVQWVGDPDLAASKHFFVSVAQLPVKLPEGQSAVQIVYNFQVLVNVSPPGQKADLAIRSVAIGDHQGKPAPVITVSNSGRAHGYLSQHRLRIVEKDAGGAEIFSKTLGGGEFQQVVGYGLIASGQTRKLTLPIDLPSGTGQLTVTLLDEQQQ